MLKHLILMAAVVAVTCTVAPISQAGPRSLDGTIALAAGDAAVTQEFSLASQAWEIDRIVFYNSGAATAGVTVAAADLGLYTTLDAYALAAGGGQNKWPRRAELSYNQATLLDSSNVVVTAANVVTNYQPFLVRDLRLIAVKGTNAVPVPLVYRIFARD
jgi:hypothetical protein